MTIRIALWAVWHGPAQPSQCHPVAQTRKLHYLIGRGAPLQITGLASPSGSDVILDQGVDWKGNSSTALLHLQQIAVQQQDDFGNSKARTSSGSGPRLPERKPRPRPGALLPVLLLRRLARKLAFRVKLSMGRTGLSAVPYYSRNQTDRPTRGWYRHSLCLPSVPFASLACGVRGP